MALTKFVNVYKCRLCGEMFTSSGTNSEIAAWKGTLHEIMKASGLDTPCSTPEVTPTMFEMHSCKNGSYGVADFQGTRKAAAPAESWMADLVPGGEYAISIAGHTLVLKPVPGTPAGIQRGHEYYHYTIGPRLYAGTFVGRMQH